MWFYVHLHEYFHGLCKQVLLSLVRAMHSERTVRRAAEEHIKSMRTAAEASLVRIKQATSRTEELTDKLTAKEKALVLLKGDLSETQDEVRFLRERVRALEEEVKVLEGNMTIAGQRAMATAQVTSSAHCNIISISFIGILISHA